MRPPSSWPDSNFNFFLENKENKASNTDCPFPPETAPDRGLVSLTEYQEGGKLKLESGRFSDSDAVLAGPPDENLFRANRVYLPLLP